MRLGRLAVLGVALMVAVVVAVVGLAPRPQTGLWLPTAAALGDIPAGRLALYQEAAARRCPALPPEAEGLPWPVLAAVGKVETDHGRVRAVSSAGARGPMQFLPSTWAAYGVDADGNGFADIDADIDAVHGAANYLCASGGGRTLTLRDAIFAYNHAQWYVDLVLSKAAEYAQLAASSISVSGDAVALAQNPRLRLTGPARADLEAGRLDGRLVALLSALTQRHVLYVSVFATGHSKYVAGTGSVSNHFCGQAADVFQVDGEAVRASSGASRRVTEELATLDGVLRPSEVGSPWADLSGLPGFFSNAAHQDHLHIGFGPRCPG